MAQLNVTLIEFDKDRKSLLGKTGIHWNISARFHTFFPEPVFSTLVTRAADRFGVFFGVLRPGVRFPRRLIGVRGDLDPFPEFLRLLGDFEVPFPEFLLWFAGVGGPGF